MKTPRSRASVDPARVLAKALLRATDSLGMSQAELARVLGTSGASASRLRRGRDIAPTSKEGELALLLLRAWRSLHGIVGGSEEAARRWFRAENHHLGGVPADLVQTAVGLVHVTDYLDATRGRL